jgi:hypothetical protein
MALGDAVARVREALQDHDCRPRGGVKLRARCPVHGSHGPTLAVSQGRVGAVMFCHAQCDIRDIREALNLSAEDLFDEPLLRDTSRPLPMRRRDPLAELTVPERRFLRGLDLMRLRDNLAFASFVAGTEPAPWQERVQAAEDDCRTGADRNYWRVTAMYAALAGDETYVRRAHKARREQLAGVADARFAHEQAVVLMTRAEDLALVAGNETPDVRGTCPADVPSDVRPDVHPNVRLNVRKNVRPDTRTASREEAS